MPLNAKEAMRRLTMLTKSAWVTQSHDNAYWMMAIMYEAGQQWGYVNPVGGQMHTQYLRNITDPQRRDVRVTMNKVGEFVRQVKAETNPHSFRGVKYNPVGGSIRNRLLAGLGSKLMKQHLQDIQALEVYRDMNMARMVLGSCAIRRTLVLRNERIFNQIVGGDIMRRPVREFSVGWSRVFPWELMRDPAAVTLRPEQHEDIVCHYKPRTVRWVMERFPDPAIQDKLKAVTTTMGRLMTYNRQIRAASGMVGHSRVANSTEPGVMVYECYFKEGNSWPKVLYAFGNPFGPDRILSELQFTDNPFHGLPFHFFHYDRPIQMPWARGIPHLLFASQDITNLGWTWLLRTMHAGSGKWMVEKGTIERPQRQLNSRIDMHIEWQRQNPQSVEPKFIPGPQPSAAAMSAIGVTPDWMSKALNLSPVQQGVVSKRGESAAAIEKRLDQAGVPLEDLRRDDELELARLMQFTLHDMTNRKWMRPDIVGKLLGPDIPSDHVRLLAREGTKKAVGSVSIPTLTLRPRTKADTRELFTDLVAKNVIEARDAQWEMYKQSGVNVNTGMTHSAEKQTDEIARMMAGVEVEAVPADHHEYHIRQLQDFIDSPQWHNVPELAQQQINDHYAEHKVAMIQMAQIDAMGVENAQGQAPPAQGSPPADPAGIPPVLPGAPAGAPELAVA